MPAHLRAIAVALLTAGLAPLPAAAETYPSRTVKLVVPVKFSGGGLSMQTTTSHIGA